MGRRVVADSGIPKVQSGSMREWRTEGAVSYWEDESTYPMMEGLPEVVDCQLLDAEKDQCIHSVWHAGFTDSPPGYGLTRTGEPASCQRAKSLLKHRVRQVH